MSETHHVVVIGAGSSGLSAALSLQERGRHAVVLEKSGQVAPSWRSRYDCLKLNTGRPFSHLPGRPYPDGTPMFPSRDELVDHLEKHSREHGLELRMNTEVLRIDPAVRGWRVSTSSGDLATRHVIVATGNQRVPNLPPWANSDDAEVLHSSAYRNPGPFVGKRVLVVGSGSSGMEIAHDVATGGAAKTWLAVRTPPNITLRGGPGGLAPEVLAIPLYHAPVGLADGFARFMRTRSLGDLSAFGLPIPAEGTFSRLRRGRVPSVVDRAVVEAVMDGSIEIVPAAEAFEARRVRLVGDRRIDPDVVICSTGYRRGLTPLVGHLSVLDHGGVPRVQGDRPAADGLWFLGFMTRPALIAAVGKQSRSVARRIG
jgi:hypothetical protein